MIHKKSAAIGSLLTLAVIFGGCASVSFPWPYYASHMADSCYDQGTLYGKPGSDGWPDLPLIECKPDAVKKLKCITLLDSDFYALKSDDMKCHQDLQSCQGGAVPQP